MARPFNAAYTCVEVISYCTHELKFLSFVAMFRNGIA